MKHKVFTIYDSKIEAYGQPFMQLNKGQAIRTITDSMTDKQTMFAKHPEDFTLFEIGEYDDQEGHYTMHTTKISIIGLWELANKDQDRSSQGLPGKQLRSMENN